VSWQKWLSTDADKLREKHVKRIRGLYDAEFEKNQCLNTELAAIVYRAAHDLVQSPLQLRSAVERGERAFTALCSSGARLGFLASVLRKHRIVVDGTGDLDEAVIEDALAGAPLADALEY
jgi:hypothetical protein